VLSGWGFSAKTERGLTDTAHLRVLKRCPPDQGRRRPQTSCHRALRHVRHTGCHHAGETGVWAGTHTLEHGRNIGIAALSVNPRTWRPNSTRRVYNAGLTARGRPWHDKRGLDNSTSGGPLRACRSRSALPRRPRARWHLERRTACLPFRSKLQLPPGCLRRHSVRRDSLRSAMLVE
jgi:hypothetical protein